MKEAGGTRSELAEERSDEGAGRVLEPENA